MSTLQGKTLFSVCEHYQCIGITEHSRPSGSFFTEVDHLFSTNGLSKQAMNHADFFTLKIWTQSDNFLKSYGLKVNFTLIKVNFLAMILSQWSDGSEF